MSSSHAPRSRSSVRSVLCSVVFVALSSTAAAHEPRVSAPGYCAHYLAEPNPLQMANGLALDGRGNLYVARVLRNSIVKIDLFTFEATEIAGDYDAPTQQLQGPDDMAFDGSGDLYVTEFLGRQVA